MEEIHLTKKDFKIEWFSGKGAGGQYRNKHQNCCRITHIASGKRATGQSNRERPANQKEAFNRLVGMILAETEVEEERRSTQSVVRDYHFARNVVTDYGSGLKDDIKKVMEGGLDEFILNRGAYPLPKSGRV